MTHNPQVLIWQRVVIDCYVPLHALHWLSRKSPVSVMNYEGSVISNVLPPAPARADLRTAQFKPANDPKLGFSRSVDLREMTDVPYKDGWKIAEGNDLSVLDHQANAMLWLAHEPAKRENDQRGRVSHDWNFDANTSCATGRKVSSHFRSVRRSQRHTCLRQLLRPIFLTVRSRAGAGHVK